jgi:hypothetical protein
MDNKELKEKFAAKITAVDNGLTGIVTIAENISDSELARRAEEIRTSFFKQVNDYLKDRLED